MSQVYIDGKRKQISHAELCEIDNLAAERGCSREEAAAEYFNPKKAARKKAAKKDAEKQED